MSGYEAEEEVEDNKEEVEKTRRVTTSTMWRQLT